MTRLKANFLSILGFALGLAVLGIFASIGLAVLGGLVLATLILAGIGWASGNGPTKPRRTA
ncbi:hypothetical protein JANAI62_36360 [Jannaschia pagri]|uniref:Uncharacterized protein n=1 Tax=Jannaschia pagri TaxID=2829797 RepID=A0ABQ4NRI1_9RHOB|nr:MULTISPECIES: hypothetical protein [unclassified Jannaschia]GIT93220.1 hypothetical protein JANAI61_36780 [Jannaschia sp. AI_61]GIT97013.1 hypothetical protein JANAI62_36360 [Jannaschia sp. AI_62]